MFCLVKLKSKSFLKIFYFKILILGKNNLTLKNNNILILNFINFFKIYLINNRHNGKEKNLNKIPTSGV